MNPEIDMQVDGYMFHLTPENTAVCLVPDNDVLDHLFHQTDDNVYRFFREMFDSAGEDFDHVVYELHRLGYMFFNFMGITPQLVECYTNCTTQSIDAEYEQICQDEQE